MASDASPDAAANGRLSPGASFQVPPLRELLTDPQLRCFLLAYARQAHQEESMLFWIAASEMQTITVRACALAGLYLTNSAAVGPGRARSPCPKDLGRVFGGRHAV